MKMPKNRLIDQGELSKGADSARSRTGEREFEDTLYFKGTNVKSWKTYPRDLSLKPSYK